MIVRDATAADIDAALALERACFAEDPWSRHMLEEELGRAGGIFLVAADGATVDGLAIGWSVLGELHVLQIAVRTAARRTGIGRRLLVALEAAATGADTAWLEVRRDNDGAIGLYEGHGYRYVATRARYYEDGCDALVYRKSLVTSSSGTESGG